MNINITRIALFVAAIVCAIMGLVLTNESTKTNVCDMTLVICTYAVIDENTGTSSDPIRFDYYILTDKVDEFKALELERSQNGLDHPEVHPVHWSGTDKQLISIITAPAELQPHIHHEPIKQLEAGEGTAIWKLNSKS